MTAADRERWDAKYAQQSPPQELTPPEWLVRHASTLPPGRALDLATGHGHAAIWLAERGWDVTAVDISPVGLQTARRFAQQRGAAVDWVFADLDDASLGHGDYDLVTVFRFLDRIHLPGRIFQALRFGVRRSCLMIVQDVRRMSKTRRSCCNRGSCRSYLTAWTFRSTRNGGPPRDAWRACSPASLVRRSKSLNALFLWIERFFCRGFRKCDC